MNFLGRASRSTSQNSRHSSPPEEEDFINADNPDVGEDTGDDDESQDAGLSHTESKHAQFTRSHPLGLIFLKMAADCTTMAKKNNVKHMDTSIPELCTAFYNGMHMERDNTVSKIHQSSTDIENSILFRELNAHKQNSAIDPPTNFSPRPVLTSQQKVADFLKIFPSRGPKFSGFAKEGSMSVIEFLTTMKQVQEQYPISEKEFLEKLLSASTGGAHELIMDWISNGENVSTVFHNLIVNYDRRVSPDDAKRQLAQFLTTKNSSLARAESQIMILAGRASTALPAGSSRTAYYNLEACHALIRALPPYSSQIVTNLFNQLSARFGRAVTFAELSRGLFVYATVIDKDIKSNGNEGMSKNKSFNGKNQSQKPRYKTFNVSSMSTENGSNWPSEYNKNSTDRSYTPRPQNRFGSQGSNRTPFGQNNKRQGNFSSNKFGSASRPKRNRDSSVARNNNALSCSLCGMKNHKATHCKNMKDDTGKQVDIIPTYGVCDRCPGHIKPKLHHPAVLCPYRKGGPFAGKSGN